MQIVISEIKSKLHNVFGNARIGKDRILSQAVDHPRPKYLMKIHHKQTVLMKMGQMQLSHQVALKKLANMFTNTYVDIENSFILIV
jgi:hypothetical protein